METSEMIGVYRSIVAETLRTGEDGEFNVVAAKFLNDMGKVLETVVKLEMTGSSNNETLDYDALLGKFSDES